MLMIQQLLLYCCCCVLSACSCNFPDLPIYYDPILFLDGRVLESSWTTWTFGFSPEHANMNEYETTATAVLQRYSISTTYRVLGCTKTYSTLCTYSTTSVSVPVPYLVPAIPTCLQQCSIYISWHAAGGFFEEKQHHTHDDQMIYIYSLCIYYVYFCIFFHLSSWACVTLCCISYVCMNYCWSTETAQVLIIPPVEFLMLVCLYYSVCIMSSSWWTAAQRAGGEIEMNVIHYTDCCCCIYYNMIYSSTTALVCYDIECEWYGF